VKDCTINGTPDCPLVKADNSVGCAGKKKAPNNDLHAFYREVHNSLIGLSPFFYGWYEVYVLPG
jgi:hypothetical protein